jgi:hypothetical protein
MFHKKMLVTAAVAAMALTSPAAALAKGGDSGSGKNSTKPPAAPAECATISNATITQEPQINMVTGEVSIYNLWTVMARGQVNNCGTQSESLVWNISWVNTKTGVREFPDYAYSIPADVAPGGSIDMLTGDGVTGTEPGKSYRFDYVVKSATTGKVLAQQSEYYTIVP